MPPKIIYKPPKSVEKATYEARQRSKRERKKKDTYQAQFPQPKLKKKLKRLAQWQVKDKPLLIQKIREHGTSDPKKLMDPDLRKSEDQIKEVIQFCKRGNKMKEVPRANAVSTTDTEWKPKEITNPIESWISLAESYRLPPEARSGSDSNIMDCSHLLSDSLATILKEEKHPDPEDCGGVDYAEIYKYIYDITNGELPKQLSEASGRKVIEIMDELRTTVLRHSPELREEKLLLERYTRRDVGTLNGAFVDKCKDPEMKRLACMPKVNPLDISASFFTKPLVRKD